MLISKISEVSSVQEAHLLFHASARGQRRFVRCLGHDWVLGAPEVDFVDLGRKFHLVHVALKLDLVLVAIAATAFALGGLVQLFPLICRVGHLGWGELAEGII